MKGLSPARPYGFGLLCVLVLVGAVVIAAELGERPEQGEIETDDIDPTPFAIEVDATPVSLNGLLPSAEPFDWGVTSLSAGDGRVCVLHVEGFTLRSLTSVDGGATFAPEVDVAGTGTDPHILEYRAVIDTDDRVHVALIVADPAGGPGLQYTRSDDLGTTWTPRATLVTDGVPSFALYKWDLDISANGTGVVAIVYTSDETGGTYLAHSLDGGNTWPEVAHRVDLTEGIPFAFYASSAVLADSNGNIHVAYTQKRDLPWTRAYVRRRASDGTWSDEGPVSGSLDNSEIRFGQFDTSGNRPTPDDWVSNGPSTSGSPQLVWNGTDYGVAWEDTRDGNAEIYFARLDSNGVSQTGDIRITNDAAASVAPSLVWTGSEFGIAWQDARDGNNEIYFARLDSTGSPVGGTIQITDDPGSSIHPSLQWAAGRYGLAWQDDRTGDDEIWFATLGPTGVQLGSDTQVTNAPGVSALPSLAPTGSGFGLAWQDDRDGNDEIYFTLLNYAGTNLGPNLRTTNDAASSTRPSLVWTGTDFGIAWQDSRDGNAEIYFERLTSAGAEIDADLRLTDDPAVSTDPHLAFGASIPLYGVAWQDNRDGNHEIYIMGIQASGVPSSPNYRWTNTSGDSTAPSIVWDTDNSVWAMAWGDLGATLPVHDTRSPRLAEAEDGSILLTYWVYAGDSVAVTRSTDGGLHYEPSFEQVGTSPDNVAVPPVLTTAPGSATVLLSYGSGGGLFSHRSSDHGASFAPATTVANLGGGLESATYSVAKGSGDVWAYTWRSTINDTYVSQAWDVFFRSSDDDGLSFGTEQRVDSGTTGVQWRGDPAIVSTPGEFLVVYPDERGNVGPGTAWGSNLFANRTLETSIAFGTDYRIDTDSEAAEPSSGYREPTVATDGVDHVYVAFNAYSEGPYATILVAASADRGKTFGTPIAVGASASGLTDSHVPLLAATPDGYVYLVYQADPTDLSGRHVRFNVSTDFGQTWQPSDTVLGSVAYADVETWGGRGTRVPGPSLAALPGGKVWVAWSDWDELYLSRSADGGQTFVTEDIDQNTADNDMAPSLCAQGDQVIVTWCGEAPLLGLGMTVWAVVSNNGGVTFPQRFHLRAGQTRTGWYPRIACDGIDSAAVVWRDSGAFQTLWTSRYDGVSWSSAAEVPGPPDPYLYYPRLTFTDRALVQPTNVVLVYEEWSGTEVYLNRSNDGGATFSPYVRLDDASPEPDNGAFWPRVAADGNDNVWVSWLDYSANRSVPSIALRRSTDGGASFDPAIRVDRQVPGALYNSYYFNTETAALPETGLFAWYAQNGAGTAGNLFLADDRSDDDSDGVNGSLDCDDEDPHVYPGAPQLCDGVNNDCNDESWPEVPSAEADADSDGLRICDGDCDDADPDTYPEAPEVNDGEDNQCSGDDGYGLIDETSGESGFHNPADRDEYSWTAQPGATQYEIARSGVPDFSTDCVTTTTSSTWWVDTEQPVEGGVFYYLNRPIAPHVGSWGRYSWGVERTAVCP